MVDTLFQNPGGGANKICAQLIARHRRSATPMSLTSTAVGYEIAHFYTFDTSFQNPGGIPEGSRGSKTHGTLTPITNDRNAVAERLRPFQGRPDLALPVRGP